MSLKTVAYHEAGHAVMARLVRRGVRHVTIVPEEERGSLGRFKPEPFGKLFRPDAEITRRTEHLLLNYVRVCLAGVAAERILHRRIAWSGAEADQLVALDMLQRISGSDAERDAWFRLLLIQAENRLRVPWVWGCVRMLAEALLDKKTLSGVAARRIISAAETWVANSPDPWCDMPEKTPGSRSSRG